LSDTSDADPSINLESVKKNISKFFLLAISRKDALQALGQFSLIVFVNKSEK